MARRRKLLLRRPWLLARYATPSCSQSPAFSLSGIEMGRAYAAGWPESAVQMRDLVEGTANTNVQMVHVLWERFASDRNLPARIFLRVGDSRKSRCLYRAPASAPISF